MRLDITTLLIISSIISILHVIAIYLQGKFNRKFKELKFWFVGNVCTSLGTFLICMRNYMDNKFLYIFFPNLILMLGQILIYIGITKFFKKRGILKIVFLLLFISTVILFYYTYINDNMNIRILIYSANMALYYLLIAYEFVSKRKLYMSVLFLGVVMLIQGIFYILRTVSSLFISYNNNFFEPIFMQQAVFLLYISMSYLFTVGLIVIINQRTCRENKLAEDKIKVLSKAVEQSPVSIVITDIKGNITYVNNKFIEITGYSKEEVLGQNARILKVGNQKSEDYKELWDNVLSGREWSGEFYNKKKNGEFYWESAIISPILDDQGNINQILAVKENITEKKRLEKELQLQARMDVLTDSFNRRYFMEMVRGELERNKRYPKENAFLMIDIDKFKMVNDRFGHSVGDEAIKLVAKTCKDTLRKTDIFGRIGGEEFAAFLIEVDIDTVLQVAERIRKNIEEAILFDNNGLQVKLTVSLGITRYHLGGDTLEMLMMRSDKALYEAKNGGRNKVFYIE